MPSFRVSTDRKNEKASLEHSPVQARWGVSNLSCPAELLEVLRGDEPDFAGVVASGVVLMDFGCSALSEIEEGDLENGRGVLGVVEASFRACFDLGRDSAGVLSASDRTLSVKLTTSVASAYRSFGPRLFAAFAWARTSCGSPFA